MARQDAKVGAVIVSAGSSTRMGGVDKIFAELAGQPLLAVVVDAFHSCHLIDEIVIVLSAANLDRGQALVKQKSWPRVTSVCPGGARRQDSVREGLSRLSGCAWVAIHDGARPCVSHDIIERGLAAARDTGAAIAGVPVTDTIKVVSDDCIVRHTPRRDALWAIQTPQVFRHDLIVDAYRKIDADVTDDAMLLEQLGHKVKVFMGSYRNIKVTTPQDLVLAEAFLRNGTR